MFDPVEGSLHLGDYGPNTLELAGVPSVGYREMRATIRTPHLTAATTLHEHPDVGISISWANSSRGLPPTGGGGKASGHGGPRTPIWSSSAPTTMWDVSTWQSYSETTKKDGSERASTSS